MYRITAILFAGLAILWTGCASSPGANHVVPKLKAISVGPADAQVPLGQTQQFSATGKYSDGTTQILTSTVTWHSSNTNVGAVSTTGLLSPVAEGMAKITATSSGVSGSTTVSVTAAAIVSLSIVRSSASIPFGTEEQFTAIATFTDQTTQNVTSSVTWASSAGSSVRQWHRDRDWHIGRHNHGYSFVRFDIGVSELNGHKRDHRLTGSDANQQ